MSLLSEPTVMPACCLKVVLESPRKSDKFSLAVDNGIRRGRWPQKLDPPACAPPHPLSHREGRDLYLRAAYNAPMHCQEQVMKCVVLLYYDRLQCLPTVAMKIWVRNCYRKNHRAQNTLLNRKSPLLQACLAIGLKGHCNERGAW